MADFIHRNHRWGICAALMQAAKLFADDTEFAKSLMDRTDFIPFRKVLIGNAEGEYAERSTGNYNAVVNNAISVFTDDACNILPLSKVRVVLFF